MDVDISKKGKRKRTIENDIEKKGDKKKTRNYDIGGQIVFFSQKEQGRKDKRVYNITFL